MIDSFILIPIVTWILGMAFVQLHQTDLNIAVIKIMLIKKSVLLKIDYVTL